MRALGKEAGLSSGGLVARLLVLPTGELRKEPDEVRCFITLPLDAELALMDRKMFFLRQGQWWTLSEIVADLVRQASAMPPEKRLSLVRGDGQR